MSDPSPPDPDPVSRAEAHAALDAALVALRRLWMHPRLLRWYEHELGAEADVTTLRTLRAIEAAGDDVGVSGLAQVLAVDASTASRLVEQAVAGGHVRRRPDEVDRRRTRLALTDTGRELLRRATRARSRLLDHATTDWQDDDVVGLAQALERLQRDLRELVEEGGCP